MITDFMIVRHSRNELDKDGVNRTRVEIVKRGYDLSNYSFLRMSPTGNGMAEWVWTEDWETYNKTDQQ